MIPRIPEQDVAPYFRPYVAQVGEDDVLGCLRTLAGQTRDLFAGMSPDLAHHRYAEGKWTPLELLGHILDTERIFVGRSIACARGDRTPWPGFDEDAYVAAAGFDARDPEDLLAEFLAQREATLRFFAGLTPDQLRNVGVANGVEFTAAAVAWVLAGHHRHHLRVLQDRYLTD